jgi:hypothetical protein
VRVASPNRLANRRRRVLVSGQHPEEPRELRTLCVVQLDVQLCDESA